MFKNNKSVIFLGSLTAILVIFVTSVMAVVDISEIPLDAQTKAAPANIMFILDDSGSMDWEFMTNDPSGLFLGDFPSGTRYPYEYVFDDPGDNNYGTWSTYGTILTNTMRAQWKSQWSEYNKMYYDPTVDYRPWPTLPDANPDNPRSHPHVNGNTFNLSGSYLVGTLGGGGTFDIPRSHYYVLPDGATTPYLVSIDSTDDTVKYYATTITDSGISESVTTYTLISTPAGVRDYEAERQNFANWYSFYRRRELTATAAVSNVINQMAGVQIGISTIHDRINQPVMKVGGVGDETADLLSILYDQYNSDSGTALRRGLQDVGQYFHQDDGNDGGIGTCPYWSVANGGECQQAFAILMTDGYYNGDSPGVGHVDDNNGVPFADTYGDTLADVAMYYWENDLSSGLGNQLTPSSADSAVYQHMVTYGVSFGVTGTLNPESYDLSTTPPWPDPTDGDKEKIDDLYHSSVDGHGTFLSAANPTELVDSLLAIMLNIEQRIGAASSVSVNGDELYKRIDENTYMFQSSYNTDGWLGDVSSYKVNSTTGDIDMENPEWSAASVWDGLDWDAADYPVDRFIATYSGSAGIRFRIGSLTSAQETQLIGTTTATAQEILDYIRGADSNTTFRHRASRLGDIVHSSPIYHNGILYVGANDGMMHALIAEGTNAGKELFSYIPSQVIRNLSLLTKPDYSHNYYVDLTVTIKDIIDSSTTPVTRNTLLVGGLGQGGIGYYALDISNLTTYDTATQLWSATSIASEAAVAGKVLWEFPHAGTTPTALADVSDIGYSFSKSLIVKTNDTNHPWVVIFGNGYNSHDGQSVLFILNPDDGTVLKKFELGSGPDNGLSTPAVTDVNGDGKADYVYAGDLSGNMWKIDLTGSDIASWEVAFNDGTDDTPLFRATGPTGVAQPITSKPDVMYHPEYHGYLVAFGTGKFLGTSDFLDNSVQTVYGVWDYGDDSDDTENLGTFDHLDPDHGIDPDPDPDIPTRKVSALTSTSTLLEQKLLLPDFTYTNADGDSEIVRVLTDNSISWVIQTDGAGHEIDINGNGTLPDLSTTVNNNAGWYFDLPNSGERVVSRMMIRDGKAIFISFTPENLRCSPGGNSILHEVDAADGSRMNTAVFDTNGDGVVNANDLIQVDVTDPVTNITTTVTVAVTGIQREGHLQTPAILKLDREEIKYMSSTAGNIETVRETAAKTGVSSWREF